MQYTINELRQRLFADVLNVYEVFKNYFGEENVDLQDIPDEEQVVGMVYAYTDIANIEPYLPIEISDADYDSIASRFRVVKPFILVYWPTVTVTNENDRSITIKDLYAKIELDYKGNIPTENRGFLLNRATYSMEQWVSSYMHSHIAAIPKHSLEQFQEPCLGHGPIIGTINSLKADITEGFDEIRWMLFCEELSRYVTVESIAGVPYNHLENVGMGITLHEYTGFNYSKQLMGEGRSAVYSVFGSNWKSVLRDFILWYLEHGHLSFDFQGGTFKVGMSHYDFIVDISNSFIAFFNSRYKSKALVRQCFTYRLLYEAAIADGKFYSASVSQSAPDISEFVGRRVCDFKGHGVTLSITNGNFAPHKAIVLRHGLAMYILDNILKIINYHYTNEHTRQLRQGTDQSHCTTLPATTGKRVFYL